MEEHLFTISELGRRAGLNPKTIRYYEQIGLLPEPMRNEAGYRLYSEEDVPRLQLVARARLLRLSLAETKEVVDYADDGRCRHLRQHLLALLEAKVREVERHIAELTAFKADLQRRRDELSAHLHAAGESGEETPCRCLDEEVKMN